MPVIEVDDLADPRLTDFADVRERQWAAEFQAAGDGAWGGGGTGVCDADAPFGKFMAEGELVFERLVRSPFRTLSVLCTPARLKTIGPALERLEPATPVYVIDAKRLEALIGFPLHRGLMAVAARNRPVGLAELLARRPRLVVVGEDLANHDNIGALFRDAAAFGADAVVLNRGCADPLYRKSVRVSMGHALRVPFAMVGPWPGVLGEVRGSGMRVVAMTPHAPAVPIRELPGRHRAGDRYALLMGAEGPGLTAAALAEADVPVRIPMAEGVDSLNVGVAAAVALEHLSHLLCAEANG